MADLERLKRALQAAHAAGDTAAATKLAQAIRAAQATPAGDTSMGTAFAVAGKQAEAAGNLGSAAITRRVNQGPLGQAQEFMFDNVGNPIREFFGMDPVDIAAVNQASSDEATAKAAKAQQSANQFAQDANFENLTLDSVNDLGSFFRYVGQKGAQAAPYMAVSMASGGTATYPFSVGEISGALEEIEGKTQEEKDKIATRGGAIMTALENLGIASLLPAGISNNIIGGIASGAITEGFTEGAQELVVIGSEAVAGKKFTEEELVSRLKEATAAGAAVGGSFKAGGQTINATSKIFSSDGSVNNPDNMSPEGAAAAGAFARRLREIAQANGYDLKDVNANSTKGARETVDKAHIQLAEELKKVFKDVGELVTPDKLKSFVETKDQILAQAAYREARNKTKSTVGQQELDAMRRLVGDTAEGQQAINLMLQLNQLTEVHNAGYKGGLSRITDVFNPLDQNINSYDTASRVVTGTLSPLATAAGAVSTGGASLAPQAALFGTGRAVDAMTGRRSTVDRFVRRNEGNSPDLPAPTAPSLVETKRLQEQQAQDETQRNQEQQKQLNLQLAQQNAPATPGSPQFTMEDATGLSRDGVARILRVLKGRNDNPALIRAIQEYEQSVATGGRIEDLSPLIRAVRQFQQENPDYVQMVRPPNSLSNPMLANPAAPGQPPVVSTTEANPVQAQTFGPQFTTQENYNRGIEANQTAAKTLDLQAQNDPNLSIQDKAVITSALDKLQGNLGTNPVMNAEAIMEAAVNSGVSQEAIDAYVKPYVDRVARQQSRDVPPRMSMPPQKDGEPSKPALQSYVNPLQIPDDEIDVTRLNFSPSEADIQAMRDGTYKPEQKRTLVEAAAFVHEKWKKATGREEPFEYTPENVDVISTYMATEAVNALQSDANAIGWYDRKLKAAKAVVSLVDPRVTQSPDAEAAFDFALAVTSNGQAVADNFQYALEVFRYFMDNGQMPTDTWGKGGERNAAMTEAFSFFNAYQSSGANMPIQDFLDADFTVKELNDYIGRFNAQYGTEIKVPSSEGANAPVKGSYIIGPKIGQGFYQNIRGNYDPLTMDIWWMRMWNRMVGRPFEAQKDVSKNRARIREAVKLKNQDQLEKSITNEVLNEMGIKRSALKDDTVLDDFVRRTESKYQSFFRKKSQELKGTKQKVPKPELFKATGTMVKNLDPQLQAQPKGPSERAYMRDVTKAAITKLRDLGYDISTADFQALMWYPEKQLFRHLGVAPGRGADNDYLDAAIMLAEAEGITNDQIQEALPDPDGDGAVNNQSGPTGVDEGLYRGAGGTGSIQEGPTRQSQPPVTDGVAGILASRLAGGPAQRSSVPSTQEVKQAAEPARAIIEVGKKGSKYEDGIKDINQVRELADAINVTIKMYSDQRQMRMDANAPNSTAAMGLYEGGIAYALDPTAAGSEFQSYITTLHEVAHGLNDQRYSPGDMRTFSPEQQQRLMGTLAGYPPPMTNKLTGRKEQFRRASFDQYIGQMLSGQSTVPKDLQKKILKEMKDLQDKGKYREGSDVRYIGGTKRPVSERKNTDYYKYIRSTPELAVDPVIYYLHDPKGMKKNYPVTAEAIREFFRNSSKIQFYSHPLAMAFAVALAMLIKAEQEDEQEKQMPPGALNQPMMPGALSA